MSEKIQITRFVLVVDSPGKLPYQLMDNALKLRLDAAHPPPEWDQESPAEEIVEEIVGMPNDPHCGQCKQKVETFNTQNPVAAMDHIAHWPETGLHFLTAPFFDPGSIF